jgi:hypothetical protein
MNLFKEVTVGGKRKRTLKTWVLFSLIGIILVPFGISTYDSIAPAESAVSQIKPQTNTQVTEEISSEGVQSYLKKDAEKNRITDPNTISQKRPKDEKTKTFEEKSEDSKKLEFYRSQTELGANKENLNDLPLWERYKKGGIDAAMTNTAADKVTNFDLSVDGVSKNSMLPQVGTGSNKSTIGDTSQNNELTQKETKKPSINFVSVIKENKDEELLEKFKNETKEETPESNQFLPPGHLIPVVFSTAVDTLGKTESIILVQVARVVTAQHQTQLLPPTRILCRVKEEIPTTKDDVSRVRLTAELLVFPNGNTIPIAGAELYDARDRAPGVVAHRIVPELYKRLLPIAMANFASGAASLAQTQTGNDINGRPIFASTAKNAALKGTSDAIDSSSKEYINKLLQENTPHSVITEGALAFIMLTQPLDLSLGSRKLKGKTVGTKVQTSTTPTANPNAGNNNILDQLSNMQIPGMPNLSNLPGSQ